MPQAVNSIALIQQPWSAVPPSPSDPLGISVDRTARELAGQCLVVCYATQHQGQPKVGPLLGLASGKGEVRRVSAPLDRLLMPLKILDRAGIGAGFQTTGLYQLGYVSQIAQSLRADPCEVVHLHQFPQWASILRKHDPHQAIVVHLHDNSLPALDRQRTARRLHDADAILAVSQHLAENIRQAYPQCAGIVHHAYAGVDEVYFAVSRGEEAPEAGPRLIYAAPISREKGAGVLIDAFERIREKCPSATLTLIGEEPEAGLVDRLRAGLTPASRAAVSFKGPLAGPALAEQFAVADIAVAPVIGEEPSGVHLLRAMAAGVCPVASKLGAFPELIQPGQSGQLVTPNDPADLAAAIATLAQNPAARRAMAERARQFTREHFTWPASAAALMQLYAQAIEHRRQAIKLGKK